VVSGAGHNSVNITGADSIWSNETWFVVGESANSNTLSIIDGGCVVSSDGYVGYGYDNPSSNNTVTVSGVGSKWINTSLLWVGKIGPDYGGVSNILNITNDGRVETPTATIGMNNTVHLDSGGLLAISGTFTNEAGATIQLGINGVADYGRLTVGGVASLDGVLDIVLLDLYAPSWGSVFDLFDWDGGIVSGFSSVSISPISFGLEWNTNNLYATGEISIDYASSDTDADGISDGWELQHFGGDCDPFSDHDGDGLDNQTEYNAGTNPSKADSDDDGLSDYIEINLTSTDPMDWDTDDDGLGDLELPEVVAWGNNDFSQTNVPAYVTNAMAVAAGGWHNLALLEDGSVAAWGKSDYGRINIPDGVTNAVAVAGGEDHSIALLEDGSVAAWGRNNYGQTDVPAGMSNTVAVAGGTYHSLALLADGSVAAWGNNDFSQTDVPPYVTNAVAVEAGGWHNLALLEDGSVATWGYNHYGQTNVPLYVTNAVAVAGGYQHSLALLEDGSVAAWGYNYYGQTNVPLYATNAVAVAGGADHSMALLEDGSVAAWGRDNYGQTNVPASVSNAVAVSAGDYHSLALCLRGDPLDSDMDDDGLNDGAEVNVYGTDPFDSDSDDDGLSDGDEINTHGTDPLDSDMDNDGLFDGSEVNIHGTDPLDSDTDGDGLSDGDEVNTHGTDPNDADTDGDGFNDNFEVSNGLDPNLNQKPAILNYIQTNIEVFDGFGLYTSNSIMDLAMGCMMLQTTPSNTIYLWLQLKQNMDLTDTNGWTSAGDPVWWEGPATNSKSFFRVHGSP
jgi:T5SS/PEP-CTERM-associated repeat protein